MNERKARQLTEGLNGVATKVLDAVPIETPWALTQIHGELARLGSHIETRVILGVLGHLCEVGLVREGAPGRWSRVQVRAKATLPSAEPEEPKQPIASVTALPTARAADMAVLDRLAELASKARAAAATLLKVADEMDAAALEAQSQMDASARDVQAVRQLKALLNSVGD